MYHIFHLIVISIAIHFCISKDIKTENHTKKASPYKPRDTETYTTILLDDEAFSLEPVAKNPRLKNGQLLTKQRSSSNKNILVHESRNLKTNVLKHHNKPQMIRSNFSKSLAQHATTHPRKEITRNKKVQKLPAHKVHKTLKNTTSKKIHNKRFIAQRRNVAKFDKNIFKRKVKVPLGKPYRFELKPAANLGKGKKNSHQVKTDENTAPKYEEEPSDKNDKSDYFAKHPNDDSEGSEWKPETHSGIEKQTDVQVKNDENNPSSYEEQPSNEDKSDDYTKQPDGDYEVQTEYSSFLEFNSNIPTTRRNRNVDSPALTEQNNSQDKNVPYSSTNDPKVASSRGKNESPQMSSTSSSTWNAVNADTSSNSPWMDTTDPKSQEMKFSQEDISQEDISQEDIVHRSLSTSDNPKSQKEQMEDQLRLDETEADDIIVSFDNICDQVTNQTCWVERQIGDVLTLAVKIDSSRKPKDFEIRWIRTYNIIDSMKGKPLEIQPGKLPWNMVSGSEGRELRLNPVTNIDIDPNCIMAKVFLLTKNRGKVLFTLLKKLFFRIDIPITDMGKIYAGAEVNINIENFITLPERGNMLFDWKLEVKPHVIQSLPSNIKVSNTGRSVLLKELKKGRIGVLSCVIYSSNRIAVAKRRFNILKIVENVRRRSPTITFDDRNSPADLKDSLRCRRIIRRSQEEVLQRLEEGNKPRSRKKRFKRVNSDDAGLSDNDCEPLKKALYSRFIRSLFGEMTTLDPKVMPVKELFKLSEEGDGTLDDVIPHEVHYVEPKVKYVTGTFTERSVGQPPFSANCTEDTDCGQNAICVIPQGQKNATGHSGYCHCRSEYYGDGFTCRKIPVSNHREKRLKRNVDNRDRDFAVPEHLFYGRARNVPRTTTMEIQKDESFETTPKVLAFEEEESFLISDCIDDKDCSVHSSCIQPTNGHPYCKCRPGYRGNGIFCWEIMDYVPPDEQFLPEEEVSPKRPTLQPDASVSRLASRTPSAEDYEEESENF